MNPRLLARPALAAFALFGASCREPEAPAVQRGAPPPVVARVAMEPSDPPSVRAWHGLSMANLKAAPAQVPGGSVCQVTHTYRGSPAEKAGIRRDDFVLALDEAPVTRFQDVGKALKGKPPGSTHTVKLWREGATLDTKLVLEAKPPDMATWQRGQWLGHPALPLRLTALPAGRALQVPDPKARLTVLDFWATWCGPCKAAMPRLDALHKQYEARGLRVVGVTSEPKETVQDYLDRNPVRYTIALDDKGLGKQAYEVSKLPTLVVIGGDGKVLARATGSEGGVEQAERIAAEHLGGAGQGG